MVPMQRALAKRAPAAACCSGIAQLRPLALLLRPVTSNENPEDNITLIHTAQES